MLPMQLPSNSPDSNTEQPTMQSRMTDTYSNFNEVTNNDSQTCVGAPSCMIPWAIPASPAILQTKTMGNGDVYLPYDIEGPDGTATGKYIWANGDTYEGQFVCPGLIKQGLGKCTYASSGSSYDGSWEADQKHGTGTFTYSDFSVYFGSYREGMREGQGRMVFSNGSVYEGQWRLGLMDGSGLMVWDSGEFYEGGWKSGQREGTGTCFFPNGCCYEGEFKDGKYSGQGTYKFASGNVYVGHWTAGMRDGRGKMTRPDGTIFADGFWTDGDFVFPKTEVRQSVGCLDLTAWIGSMSG